MTPTERLSELTEQLPELEALETYIGGPAVLFQDDKGVTNVGIGTYRDKDIAMMRTYAKAGSELDVHQHADEHEWFGVITGKVELRFKDNGEVKVLDALDTYHVLPGRPHSVYALEDTYAWSITIPPASGYPQVTSCPMAAKFNMP